MKLKKIIEIKKLLKKDFKGVDTDLKIIENIKKSLTLIWKSNLAKKQRKNF